jgi:hypothetical protein
MPRSNPPSASMLANRTHQGGANSYGRQRAPYAVPDRHQGTPPRCLPGGRRLQTSKAEVATHPAKVRTALSGPVRATRCMLPSACLPGPLTDEMVAETIRQTTVIPRPGYAT